MASILSIAFVAILAGCTASANIDTSAHLTYREYQDSLLGAEVRHFARKLVDSLEGRATDSLDQFLVAAGKEFLATTDSTAPVFITDYDVTVHHSSDNSRILYQVKDSIVRMELRFSKDTLHFVSLIGGEQVVFPRTGSMLIQDTFLHGPPPLVIPEYTERLGDTIVTFRNNQVKATWFHYRSWHDVDVPGFSSHIRDELKVLISQEYPYVFEIVRRCCFEGDPWSHVKVLE